MAKVSVVIPCYNHGQYIDDAVESVLQQTFQDIEIIIVNDGSTDPATIEKLNAYTKPKTTVLYTPNQGPSAARNTGIQQAQGTYILNLDADDYFDSTFLEHAVRVLDEQPTVGVVSCGLEYIGAAKRRLMPKGGDVKDFLFWNNAFASALFRKICWEQAGGYDEKMRDGDEDWNLWIGVTKHGWRVHILPEYLLHYRQIPNSRYNRTKEIRPFLTKQIVGNHKDIFAQYVDDVLVEKEKKIVELRQLKNDMANSPEYKLGYALYAPCRILRRLLRR